MAGRHTSQKRKKSHPIWWIIQAVVVLLLGSIVLWLIRPGADQVHQATDSSTDQAVLARIEACKDAPLEYLVTHTSDTDWRVRAAAYEALSEIALFRELPLRDTPLGKREALLLEWLDQNTAHLATDLCELYVSPQQLRLGKTLTQRCMTCHLGPEPSTEYEPTQCAPCHEQIHQQWSGTAHANSLTHLRYITIDPTTRQQVPLEFEGQMGLSCIACHEATQQAPQTDCVASFKTLACGTCHSQAQSQWEVWRTSDRYQHANWPPGSLEKLEGPPLGCTDCHMKEHEHLWAARRDPAFLQSGIKLNIRRGQQQPVVIELYNLTGHAFPTETTRRSLQLFIQTDDGEERLLAELADQIPGYETGSRAESPMAPGEVRQYPLEDGVGIVRARLVFVRNRFQEGTYTIQIAETER